MVNILRGDIRVIGPRPERPEFSARLGEAIPFYRARLAVNQYIGGNDVIASAILGPPYIHHSHVFLITGPSYRIKGKLDQPVDQLADVGYNAD